LSGNFQQSNIYAMTTKQQEHKAKRKALRDLSRIAKARIEADCEGMTVNEVLLQKMYTDDDNTEFNTLFEWSKKGFKVNKGEHAFLIWGKPKPTKKGEESKKPGEQTDEDDDSFFPLCYLFSNAQVTERDAKN
jgi:hypothetical protein